MACDQWCTVFQTFRDHPEIFHFGHAALTEEHGVGEWRPGCLALLICTLIHYLPVTLCHIESHPLLQHVFQHALFITFHINALPQYYSFAQI
jgi:hypothetical protein